MKCGICGKDTMRGWNDQEVPIYDSGALAQHKRAEHKTEYYAAIEARRTKAETTAAEAKRVSDARLAASRPVVVRYREWEPPVTYPSSNVHRHEVSDAGSQRLTYVRFPDPDRYGDYRSVMAEIVELEAEARGLLTAAWEMGTPVTLEHLDELDRAAINKVDTVTTAGG